MENPLVLERFPTEKYKRFWYPTRPLLTLCLGLFLASLGYIGILPMGLALWMSAVFAFDDLPLTPIMSIFTSANNLSHGRKKIKSWIMLGVLSLSIPIGGLLGFFVVSQMTALTAMLTTFIAATSCSPVLVSTGAILGSLIAHKTHVLSPTSGILLGLLAFSLFPIPVPLIVDIVFISAASLAFLSTIVTKQALRSYYKWAYNHSNADGYAIDKSQTELDKFTADQATKFGVTHKEFKDLVDHCRTQIKTLKEHATILDEFVGERQLHTSAYKDIYHGLMNPNANVDSVKQLLKDSTECEVRVNLGHRNEEDLQVLTQTAISGKLRSDMSNRTFFHQIQLKKGLAKDLVDPFVSPK